MAKTGSQVNIRVPPELHADLKAIAFVREARSVQALLLPVIRQYVETERLTPEVMAVVRAKKESSAKRQGKLQHLEQRRTQKPSV
jgi:hypothetical protein